jgi:hypothetical protein
VRFFRRLGELAVGWDGQGGKGMNLSPGFRIRFTGDTTRIWDPICGWRVGFVVPKRGM